MKALGFIEVIGLGVAIEIADASLKAANVNLLSLERIGSGIITIILSGDVDAISVSVDVGTNIAKRYTSYRTSNVIARASDELKEIIINKPKEDIKIAEIIEKQEDICEENVAYKIIEDKNFTETKENINKKISNNKNEVIEELKILEDEFKILDEDILRKTLKKKNVATLRCIARDIKIEMTSTEIKFGKKTELIDKIIQRYKEGEK